MIPTSHLDPRQLLAISEPLTPAISQLIQGTESPILPLHVTFAQD